MFELICRAGEGRALELMGSQTTLCARCLGLYLGLLLGLATWCWLRPRARNGARWAMAVVLLSALANLAQVGAEQAGWVGSHAPTRTALGLALGIGLALVGARAWPITLRRALRVPSLAVVAALPVAFAVGSLLLVEGVAAMGVVLAVVLVISSVIRSRAASSALPPAKDCVS